MAAYKNFKVDSAHHYVDTERTMNQAGYFLLRNDMLDAAIRIFTLNVEAYPESWNAHDNLGEALALGDRPTRRIESYSRSIELNPASEAGVGALARLRSDAR